MAERKHRIETDSFGAKVILDRKGRYVATVRLKFTNSAVTANVTQTSAAAARCVAKGFKPDAVARYDEPFGYQAGKASGYGYDKQTAALRGMVIDGHLLTDHCDRTGAPKPPKGRTLYPRDFTPPKGYSVANWSDPSRSFGRHGVPEGEEGYADCYKASGLDYLKALGYQIINAL